VAFAVWLESGRGFVQLVNILRGDTADEGVVHLRAAHQLEAFCRKNDILAFPIAAVACTVPDGIQLVLQTAAVGPIRPNVALFGWNSGSSTVADYVEYLRSAVDCKMSIVIVSGDELPLPPGRGRIDIWWRGRKNGALMLLLAYLLSRNWEWARAHMRLLRVVAEEEAREPNLEALTQLTREARVRATPEVIVSDRPFLEVLHERSADADCIFLGFEIPTDDELTQWHAYYERFLANMPTTLLVNSREAEGLLA
jgi:hypothetical protein